MPPLRSMVLWKPWGQSLRLTVKKHSFVSSPGDYGPGADVRLGMGTTTDLFWKEAIEGKMRTPP